MKKYLNKIIVITLLIISTNAYSQISFSCDYREYCYWDKTNQEYINCRGHNESSLFDVNKGETMATHTTEDIQSTYYLSNKKVDSETNTISFIAKSDVGNSYIMMFSDKQISFLSINDNSEIVLIKFSIKKIF